jgi:hypothetical protein
LEQLTVRAALVLIKILQLAKQLLVVLGTSVTISQPAFPREIQVLRVADHHWTPCDNGNVPQGAFICGLDKDGSNLYVGRAFYQGDLLPGKIVPSHGCAYVSRNGLEHSVKHYEVRRAADFLFPLSPLLHRLYTFWERRPAQFSYK